MAFKDIIDSIFDISKTPSKLFGVITVLGTLLFYFPDLMPYTFDKTNNVFMWVFIVYFLSIGMLLANIVYWIVNRIRITYLTKKVKTELVDSLDYLDENEKSVLREFYLKNVNVIELVFDDPAVLGLVNKSIIYNCNISKSTYIVHSNGQTTYSINEYLKKNVDLKKYIDFNITRENFQENLELIISKRPRWATGQIMIKEN